MSSTTDFELPVAEGEPLRLSPTDLSQFIRLEQCERYLRLRLYEHRHGQQFFRDYGVHPQPIAPLLTRSGREFEERVEAALAARFRTAHLKREAGGTGSRRNDNERLVAEASGLPPGESLILFQPRLQVGLGGWELSGDADLLRLERSAAGDLRALIVDLKSTTQVKVEHRLQVAFYQAILAEIFAREGIGPAGIETAILYPGPADAAGLPPGAAARLALEQNAARERLRLDDALLQVVEEPQAYLDSVRDLVTGPDSLARRAAQAPFENLPFHLTHKCDGCVNNEFCLKWAAERDDLSLIPHLTAGDKAALQRAGITTARQLAELKGFRDGESGTLPELVPGPGKETLCRQVATSWPVGPRVDEMVHRARRYRKWKGDGVRAVNSMPLSGYGSLPYCDAEQNPNLVRVFLDAQHDYLHDRLYMAGALVVACEAGKPARRRSIVRMTDGPPDSAAKERELFLHWIRDTLRAVVELAAPDATGAAAAPIHLVFYDSLEQRLLLEGLARHSASLVAGAPALYDFITQLAAFDSPIATFLDQEIAALKNYPMLCQSLQGVAGLLKFKWDEAEPFKEIFRERLFDHWGKLDRDGDASEWYTARARFSSMIPLEFAYAAWGELEVPPGGPDPYAAFRGATVERLERFQARRLAAMERITADFPGNKQTTKTPFRLPDLAAFSDRAHSLAEALDEFVTLERHAELGAWKTIRHAAPERRVMMGETLLARYREEDQEPETVERNRENRRRQELKEAYELAWRAAHPGETKPQLTKEQRDACRWSQEGLRFRLRLETAGLDCSLDEALALTTLTDGDHVVVYSRWDVDRRLPPAERTPYTPTPKQLLYGPRAGLARFALERDPGGRVTGGWVELEMVGAQGGPWSRGFLFGAIDRAFVEDAVYTLDGDPNNIYGYWSAKVTEGLKALEAAGKAEAATLYARLKDPGAAAVRWPAPAAAGQARFLEGLDALGAAGALHDFEPGKRDYLGARGEAPLLLVQGPPGTGKSYSTAFALFARLQGALAAGRDFRALVSCKTHAATDVLLENLHRVQELLRELWAQHPELCGRYLDPRLLDVPLFRLQPRGAVPEGVTPLRPEAGSGAPKVVDELMRHRWCIAASAPGGIYRSIKEKWDRNLFGHHFCDCLVLDEASQMNLPEAIMAALPLDPGGQLIVVGDHRQMPPIVKHNWADERRRTFQEYRAYESLFTALQGEAAARGDVWACGRVGEDPGFAHTPTRPHTHTAPPLPIIRFEESFRLHRDMAEFLRQEIYGRDGIRFHSRRRDALPAVPHADSFLAAVLAPEHPLVVVLHEEASSQKQNAFEQALIAPFLEALADPSRYRLDALTGLGVVVPHRAQRAALQLACPCLTALDPETNRPRCSAVDTVERFQGGERTAIVVSATESDREYLLRMGEFLLDPRRLTVAMSRAKQKLVLVASRSLFSLFSPDEEIFQNSQLWKNLLRRTCTVPLWQGQRDGVSVEVWGNR
jgi:hypothetical protein